MVTVPASSTRRRAAALKLAEHQHGSQKITARSRFGLGANFNRMRVRSFILNGAPEEIRTPDPQIRSLVLYPAELRARKRLCKTAPHAKTAAGEVFTNG